MKHSPVPDSTKLIAQKSQVEERIEPDVDDDHRGEGIRENVIQDHWNFICFYQIAPGKEFKGDSTMVRNYTDVLLDNFSRITFTIDFPYCFDQLQGDACNFEFNKSCDLQPARFHYLYNVVTHSIAEIFVHTHTGGQHGHLSDDAVVGGKIWGELRQ